MLKTTAVALALLLGGAPAARAAEEAGEREGWTLPAATGKKLALGAAAAGVVASAAMLDDAIRRPEGGSEYADTAGFFAGEGSAFDRLGRPETTFALAGITYAAGRFMGSTAAQRVGVVGVGALAVTGLATWGLKSAAGRARPYVGGGPGIWKGFKGEGDAQASFPSGHTSMAFTLAAVAAEDLPPIGDAAVYGLATAVGASRIHQDQHWATDVLAGAALGWAIGKGVARWERKSRWSGKLVASPTGVYFTRRF